MKTLKTLQIQPMFAVPGEPFDDEKYIFEVKWDGYRAIAYLDTVTRLQSRNLKDFTLHYPNLLDLHRKVKGPAVLDGEIITLEDGKPSFQRLQARQQNNVIFVAFDVLYYKDKLTTNMPLAERKQILDEIVMEDSNLLISQYVFKSGLQFFDMCTKKGLEGMVAKEINSLYHPGKRVKFWRKIKSVLEDDFIIVGFLPGKASVIGSLALARYEAGELKFKGLVGTGLTEGFKKQLLEIFTELRTDEPPVNPNAVELRGCHYILPHLVCTVNFLEETNESRLRHPSFKALRFDKFAKDMSPQ